MRAAERKELQVVTAILERKTASVATNPKRLALLEAAIAANPEADVVVFPAGMFHFAQFHQAEIESLLDDVSEILRQNQSKAMVCVGVDCAYGTDQLAYAVSREGVAAAARKFYPTQSEDGEICCAPGAFECENGLPRTFTVKGKTLYMAVCYDCFGIRHKKIRNTGMDGIVALVHGFYPRGESGFGDVDFAGKGLAGASACWQVPVFASTVFHRRKLPDRWPSALLWKDKKADVRHFTYQDNLLQARPETRRETLLQTRAENCICRAFTF